MCDTQVTITHEQVEMVRGLYRNLTEEPSRTWSAVGIAAGVKEVMDLLGITPY